MMNNNTEGTQDKRTLKEIAKTADREVKISEWDAMSRREITQLTRKAARGDRQARSKLLRYSWAISTEANKRFDALEKADKAYGGGYNRAQFYLQIQYDDILRGRADRARTPVELRLDWYGMREQNDQLVHWLTKSISTVEGQIAREKHMLNSLKELNIISDNVSYEDSEEFLRWLGNEEIQTAIDEYGTSDEIVEAFHDMYQQKGKRGLDILSRAFVEYYATRNNNNPTVTFNEAMERVGIKIEDYKGRNGKRNRGTS